MSEYIHCAWLCVSVFVYTSIHIMCVCLYLPLYVSLYEPVPLGRGMFVYMTVCHYFYVCICISVDPYGRVCENPNLCLYMPVSVDVSVCGIASGCYEDLK